MTEISIAQLAGEAYGWFESAERTDGAKFTRTKDGAPEWVTELVYEAHGSDFLPDDWRYDAIHSALDYINENGADNDSEHEWADSYVDVYAAARYAWLVSNVNRQGYIDQAVSEFGMEPTSDVAEMIGLGQYVEAREVFSLVLSALGSRAEILAGEE